MGFYTSCRTKLHKWTESLPLQAGGKNGEESEGLWAKFRAQYNMAVLRDPMIVITALVNCLSFTTAFNIFVSTLKI